MQTMLRPVLIVLLSSLMTHTVLAEHAKTQLQVSSPREQVVAYVDQTPPDWGKNPRPILKARVREPIKIECILTNVYPHKTLENVVVHFFVVRQKTSGQKEIPSLSGDVVLETAFDMDFKPGGKAGQRATIRIDNPGSYLVRVETRNTQSDHEHFTAIDLQITNPAIDTPAQTIK